jgi:hypothetical protein
MAQAANNPMPGQQTVAMEYEYSENLPELIEQLRLSNVVSTDQAGQSVTVKSNGDGRRLGFTPIPQAIGLTRTAIGLGVCRYDQKWLLKVNQKSHAGSNRMLGTASCSWLAPQA